MKHMTKIIGATIGAILLSAFAHGQQAILGNLPQNALVVTQEQDAVALSAVGQVGTILTASVNAIGSTQATVVATVYDATYGNTNCYNQAQIAKTNLQAAMSALTIGTVLGNGYTANNTGLSLNGQNCVMLMPRDGGGLQQSVALAFGSNSKSGGGGHTITNLFYSNSSTGGFWRWDSDNATPYMMFDANNWALLSGTLTIGYATTAGSATTAATVTGAQSNTILTALQPNGVSGTDPVGTVAANGRVTTVGSSTPWTGLGFVTQTVTNGLLAANGNGSALTGITASQVGALATSGGTVAGTLTVTNLTVSGNETVAGTLGVTGSATLSSTLGVTGMSTLSGGATLGSNLNAGGHAITNTAPDVVSLSISSNVTAVAYFASPLWAWIPITNSSAPYVNTYNSGNTTLVNGTGTLNNAGVYDIELNVTGYLKAPGTMGYALEINGNIVSPVQGSLAAAVNACQPPVICVITNLPAGSTVVGVIQAVSAVNTNYIQIFDLNIFRIN